MSSVLAAGNNFSAFNCVDGVLVGGAPCMSEANVTSPWLSVRLPSNSSVSEVVVHPREDCCQADLSPFEVWVSEGEGSPDYGVQPQSGAATLCGGEATSVPATAAGPFRIFCGGIKGNYVTLRLPGPERTLSLAELRVFGPATPTAQPPVTAESAAPAPPAPSPILPSPLPSNGTTPSAPPHTLADAEVAPVLGDLAAAQAEIARLRAELAARSPPPPLPSLPPSPSPPPPALPLPPPPVPLPPPSTTVPSTAARAASARDAHG